jgi:hypothetical protein
VTSYKPIDLAGDFGGVQQIIFILAGLVGSIFSAKEFRLDIPADNYLCKTKE